MPIRHPESTLSSHDEHLRDRRAELALGLASTLIGDLTISLLASDATGSNCRRGDIDDSVEDIQAAPHRKLLDSIEHVASGVLKETPQPATDVWVAGTCDPSRRFIATLTAEGEGTQSSSNTVISAPVRRQRSADELTSVARLEAIEISDPE